eukprot:s2063_g4.t1
MTLLWKAGWILSLSLRASAATMSCKLAVVARKDLGMSAGKLAAQECDPKKLDAWEEDICHITRVGLGQDGSMIVVLEANSEEELKGLEALAKRQSLQVAPITDEGLTEVEDETLTVLAIGPDASKKVDTVTGKLSLYRDEAAELREKLKAAESELAKLKERLYDLELTLFGHAWLKPVADWHEMARRRMSEHLYYACSFPGCGMANWILRTDFEREYRSRGLCNWVCPKGHRNCVLPSQEDINEVNRNLLSHPEYYTDRCGHDSLALRRFRLCPECVQEGLLTFAIHEDGCKQWPGTIAAHRHCFCWHCTRKWNVECSHATVCQDPGIQQVRRTTDGEGSEKLEIGFVNAQAYIQWIGTGLDCPDTLFAGGTGRIRGATRQGLLAMEDREELRKWMLEGTT